jgi:hypothetical protein
MSISIPPNRKSSASLTSFSALNTLSGRAKVTSCARLWFYSNPIPTSWTSSRRSANKIHDDSGRAWSLTRLGVTENSSAQLEQCQTADSPQPTGKGSRCNRLFPPSRLSISHIAVNPQIISNLRCTASPTLLIPRHLCNPYNWGSISTLPSTSGYRTRVVRSILCC